MGKDPAGVFHIEGVQDHHLNLGLSHAPPASFVDQSPIQPWLVWIREFLVEQPKPQKKKNEKERKEEDKRMMNYTTDSLIMKIIKMENDFFVLSYKERSMMVGVKTGRPNKFEALIFVLEWWFCWLANLTIS